MLEGLVSIITPCYNSASYIHRLFDSILMQDYPSIEMYAVDDGSTDNTHEFIESYIPKFEKKGYKLHYLYQENAGQSVAINRGLKLISGEFLIWPDSDDYFRIPSAISIMVNALREADDEYGLVRCKCRFIEEGTMHEFGEGFDYSKSEELFIPFLIGEEFGGGAGVYMVKVSAFDKAVINREIYTGRRPQNCQLLLPLFHLYKCKTILDQLINILVRNSSHSHTVKSYEGQLDDIQGYIDIHINTLKRMGNLSDEERMKYIRLVNNRFLNDKIALAFNFGRNGEARAFGRELCAQGGNLSKGKRVKLLLSYIPGALHLAERMKHWL